MMGFYIEGPARGKVDFICAHFGAQPWDGESSLIGAVVVLDNGPFEAAAFCYDCTELGRILDSPQPKTILTGDYDTLAEAAGYYA